MFGLFRNQQPPIQTPPGEVEVIARGVKGFLGPQLLLLNKDEGDMLSTKFLRGYLIGTLDAISQRRLIANEEHTLVAGAVFGHLFPDGFQQFRMCLDLEDDADFNLGRNTGGGATTALLNGNTRDGWLLASVWPGGPRS